MKATADRLPSRRRSGRWIRLILRLLVLLTAAALLCWFRGPVWLAPAEDFPQGPGGAAAYISLYRQVLAQGSRFWEGDEVRLALTEEEFSGLLASALLSGRQEQDPIRKVRASLLPGAIAVETILRPCLPSLPQLCRRPVGVSLWLHPTVTAEGQVHLTITRAALGRIPVPPWLIRQGRRFLPASPLFDPDRPAVVLPLGDLVAAQTGRRLTVREIRAARGRLTVVIALTR